ncbi:MAG TPA: helix-turn-helix domain-containing protein [Thermoanaerobaculia bacterium]|nr:helix-turn-helix domain-containing protein [Thermoanaerobaculia bacterium]
MTPLPPSGTLTAMTGRPLPVPSILRTLTLGSADWETRGVLRPQTQPQRTPARFPPAADLSAFVDLYWIAHWDLAPGATTVVETLPHPCVNVVVEQGGSLVHGPVKGRFSRTLAGRGRVVSARLRPGAFRAFCKRPAWQLVGTSMGFPAAFGVASGPLESAMLVPANAQADERAMVGVLEQFLRERLPAPDPATLDVGDGIDLVDTIDRIDRIDGIIACIAADRDLVRVEDLAQAVSLGRRSLERLFREYVGPSPKWVIRQYRLQAAADEAAKGKVANWSRLASELGYADQAHFIRDFRAILGATPTEFARQAALPRPVA